MFTSVVSKAAFMTILLLSSAEICAQDSTKQKPDFSGEWVNEDLSLKISQQGPKLTMTSTYKAQYDDLNRLLVHSYSWERVYYLDGRGETQKGLEEGHSVTGWMGDKIVTQSYQPVRDGIRQVDSIWEMSTDRSELMTTLTIKMPRYERTERFIFIRRKLWGKERTNISNAMRPATTPTFAGTWVLDKSKEENEGPIGDQFLIIEHNEPQIKFLRRLKSKLHTKEEAFVYYTDGRGEKNVIDDGPPMRFVSNSVTKREARDIVITISATSRTEREQVDRVEKHTWKVSDDGNTLKETVLVTRESSQRSIGYRKARPVTHTYVRVP